MYTIAKPAKSLRQRNKFSPSNTRRLRFIMGRRAKTKQSAPLPLPQHASTTDPSPKQLGKRKLNQITDSSQAPKKQRTKAKSSNAVKSLKKQKQRAHDSDQPSESAWEDLDGDDPALPGATSFVHYLISRSVYADAPLHRTLFDDSDREGDVNDLKEDE